MAKHANARSLVRRTLAEITNKYDRSRSSVVVVVVVVDVDQRRRLYEVQRHIARTVPPPVTTSPANTAPRLNPFSRRRRGFAAAIRRKFSRPRRLQRSSQVELLRNELFLGAYAVRRLPKSRMFTVASGVYSRQKTCAPLGRIRST